MEDVLATARDVLKESRVPTETRDLALSRIARSQLSTSRRQLIFSYKLAFEQLRRNTFPSAMATPSNEQAGANGRQPSGSEAHRTSPAAASRHSP